MPSSAALPDTALAVGSKVGRYFGIVSMLPAVLLVMFLVLLSESGAWSGKPDVGRGVAGVQDLSLTTVASVVAGSLVVALLLHPVQVPFTQFLEGYWGTSRLGIALASERVEEYRKLYQQYQDDRRSALVALTVLAFGLPTGEKGVIEARRRLRKDYKVTTTRIIDRLNSQAGSNLEWIGESRRFEEANRRLGSLPDERSRIMPTRLGNVLRRYEDLAGRRYGMDAVSVVPRLALVAPPDAKKYVQDSREGLDLAVRMCLVSSIAMLFTIGALATDGLWLILAIIPWASAYISYVGAVSAAHEYGTALCVLADLGRFQLYERMNWSFPENLDEERTLNLLRSEMIGGANLPREAAEQIIYVVRAAEVADDGQREGRADSATSAFREQGGD